VSTISAASLLVTLDSGRGLAEFTGFLAGHVENELPAALDTFLDDISRRVGQLTNLGHVRVIECADVALATLIARDRVTRSPVSDRRRSVCRRSARHGAEVPFRVAENRLLHAHGYVSKSATSAELATAVATVLTGLVLAAHLIGELCQETGRTWSTCPPPASCEDRRGVFTVHSRELRFGGSADRPQ
jgi:hypothetical protein